MTRWRHYTSNAGGTVGGGSSPRIGDWLVVFTKWVERVRLVAMGRSHLYDHV